MNVPRPDLILLKGAPGVGKSTAARHLAHQLTSGVRVEVDDLRKMVIDVKWTDQSEHRAILLLSARMAGGFLIAGFSPVILVDTFSGDKIDGFLRAFQSEYPQGRVFVAALHASEDVLRGRVLNREEGGFRDLSVSSRINQEMVRDRRPFETLVDTSALTPTQVAHSILAAIEGDTPLAISKEFG